MKPYGFPIYTCRVVRTGRKLYGKIAIPGDVARLLHQYFKGKDREEFVTVMLDGAHQAIGFNSVTTGLADKTHVHPREVFKPAFLLGAVAIIISHNHPSLQLPVPSREDREVTIQLKEAGQILGIEVLDHIIVANNMDGNPYYSFQEEGAL